MIRPLRSLVSLLLLVPATVAAQVEAEVCRFDGRLSSARAAQPCLDLRALGVPGAPGSPDPWDEEGLRLLPTRWTTAYRTAYPVDRARGVLWGGRGVSTGLSTGASFRWGPVRGAVEPDVAWMQNRSLTRPDTTDPALSPLAYPWGYGRLDRYLRPGSRSRLELGPGQSFVEAVAGPVALGASTETLRWGPARRYPLLFGGTGPGLPHVYARTPEALPLPGEGSLTTEILWGRTRESDWFDADGTNNTGLVEALHLGWEVGFVPGLEVAYSLVRHEPLPGGELEIGQLAQILTGDGAGEEPARRGTPMGTFSFRIHVPEEGVEVYGEVGRGEGFVNPEPGVSEIGFDRIYLLGFTGTRLDEAGAGWRISGELMKQALARPQPDTEAGTAVAASSWRGHTHMGRPLGAWVGVGSNAQFLALDRLRRAGSLGLYLERIRRDDDTYYREFLFDYGPRAYDLEWTVGLRFAGWLRPGWLETRVGPLSLAGDVAISRRKNRWFIGLQDLDDRTFLREWNASGELRLSWHPGLLPAGGR